MSEWLIQLTLSLKHLFPRPAPLLRFLVARMLAATAAELPKLKTLRRSLFILRRRVITTLTFRALKHNIIARHDSPFQTQKNPPKRWEQGRFTP
jgi:hypothetical protein